MLGAQVSGDASDLGGQEFQTRNVARHNDGEVSSVDRRDLRFTHPLAKDNHRSVNKSESEIRVLLLQIGHTNQVHLGRRLEQVCAALDVLDEDSPCGHTKVLAHPIIEFTKDRGRDDEGLMGAVHQVNTRTVMTVLRIQQREHYTRIKDQRHGGL